MKVIWEGADIRSGMIVGKPGRRERWLICCNAVAEDMVRYCLVSLSDGIVLHSWVTDAALAAMLNEAGEIPAALLPEAQQ